MVGAICTGKGKACPLVMLSTPWLMGSIRPVFVGAIDGNLCPEKPPFPLRDGRMLSLVSLCHTLRDRFFDNVTPRLAIRPAMSARVEFWAL
jgi:hypothetical protein